MTSTTSDVATIADLIRSRAASLPVERRFVVALAGPPAAGKSTTALALQDALGPRAAILGLDAFHFDDRVLDERGHKERKGAPHTFDVVAYRHVLALLRNEAGVEMAVPVFDRSLELSRNCAEVVTAAHRIVVTEGNYLLLNDDAWTGLRPLFDLAVWIDVSIETVRDRIVTRWLNHGFDREQAVERAEKNDLPNARTVLANSAAGDVVFTADRSAAQK